MVEPYYTSESANKLIGLSAYAYFEPHMFSVIDHNLEQVTITQWERAQMQGRWPRLPSGLSFENADYQATLTPRIRNSSESVTIYRQCIPTLQV